MKNFKYIHVVFLSCIGIWMMSCQPKSSKVANGNIRFDSVRVEKVSHLLDEPGNPASELQINFIYPAEGLEPELLASVKGMFVRTFFGEEYKGLAPAEAVKRHTDEYLAYVKSEEEEYKKSLLEHSHDDDGLDNHPAKGDPAYYEYLRNEILYNKHNLLSWAVSREDYAGGAHGSYSYLCYNINLATGEDIDETDLFEDALNPEIAQMIINKLAKQYEVADAKNLEEIGFFSLDEIKPNNNFTISDTGITYYFNQYEIAAYAVGLVSVHLPFKEVAHLLRSGSPIQLLC